MIATNTVASRAFAVWWKDLERWDVKFFSARVHSAYPVVRLAPLIQQHSERVKPFDYPETTFRILGVKNTGGIFHAYDSLGKKIKQPYQKVDAGDFAYNPYRVNIGSIGVVPTELGGNYISPAYVVFATDKAMLLPEYLILILKADWFNPMVRAATAGSVRQNLTFDLLGSLEIPLPPLAKQEVIVDRWRKAQDEITASRERVEKQKITIDARFFADLGLRSPAQSSMPKAFGVLWSDFLRWGVRFNQLSQAGADITQGVFPVAELDSFLEVVQYGTSEKANITGNGVPILRISNIKERTIDFSELKHILVPKRTIEGLMLQDGDVLIIRTSGSRDLVGTCAVFRGQGHFVFASYLIRLRFDNKTVLPEFVSWFLNSLLGRQQVNTVSRQIMQNNINSEELRSLQIPLPPLSVQKQIMEKVAAGREEIAHKREAASRITREINDEIKALVLGTKKVSEL